jgi:hypothetical protein
VIYQLGAHYTTYKTTDESLSVFAGYRVGRVEGLRDSHRIIENFKMSEGI